MYFELNIKYGALYTLNMMPLMNLLFRGLAALSTTTGSYLAIKKYQMSTSLSKIWQTSLSKICFSAEFTKK